jgi:TetR/AcrR family transcriptional regulator, regulator of cefoperazone and chloramphenicol sensitivity
LPRDSTATKARLLREAERLFARRGLYQVTLREITTAAGQRNVSALNYHFGSREGVLGAILDRHGVPIDAERGELLARLGDDPATRDLVLALVIPYARPLRTPEGRDYLRIVAQLAERFSRWRTDESPNLLQILGLLEERPATVPPALRRERLVGAILLMTSAMAERARLAEGRRDTDLDEPVFLANLADMIVGILEAPVGAPVHATELASA